MATVQQKLHLLAFAVSTFFYYVFEIIMSDVDDYSK